MLSNLWLSRLELGSRPQSCLLVQYVSTLMYLTWSAKTGVAGPVFFFLCAIVSVCMFLLGVLGRVFLLGFQEEGLSLV